MSQNNDLKKTIFKTFSHIYVECFKTFLGHSKTFAGRSQTFEGRSETLLGLFKGLF